MAAAYKSLAAATITSIDTDRINILRLNSPPSGSGFGSGSTDNVAFQDWVTDGSAIALDIAEGPRSVETMDLGIEMQTGGAGSAGGGSRGVLDAFDNDTVFVGDGLLEGIPPLPFIPSYDLENFSSTFEDPFYQPETFASFRNTSLTLHPVLRSRELLLHLRRPFLPA